MRVILISTGKPEYTFEPDIVVAVVGLLAWAGATLVLLSPPSSVLARYYGQKSLIGVVWSLGRRFRIWNVLAVPLGGLLLGLLAVVPIHVWTEGTTDLWNRLIVTALFAFASAFTALFLVRLGICGVELTPTTLIARGYLLTRRYPRATVESAEPSELGILADFGLALLMNSGGTFYTVKIRLQNGRTRLLYASNSSLADVEHGARVVDAWLADGPPQADRSKVVSLPR